MQHWAPVGLIAVAVDRTTCSLLRIQLANEAELDSQELGESSYSAGDFPGSSARSYIRGTGSVAPAQQLRWMRFVHAHTRGMMVS